MDLKIVQMDIKIVQMDIKIVQMDKKKQFKWTKKNAQQEKIQRTEEKRCTVNHVAEFKNGTLILKERKFGSILYGCD